MFICKLKHTKFKLIEILLKTVLMTTLLYYLYINLYCKFNFKIKRHQLSDCVTCKELFNIFLNHQLFDDLFIIDHRILASNLNTIDKQQLFDIWQQHGGHQLINQVNHANIVDQNQISLGIFARPSNYSKVNI